MWLNRTDFRNKPDVNSATPCPISPSPKYVWNLFHTGIFTVAKVTTKLPLKQSKQNHNYNL